MPTSAPTPASFETAAASSVGPADAETANTPSKGKKGKNFTPKEDEQLAKSWLDIAQDPVVGNEQKADAFWGKVHKSFTEGIGTFAKVPRTSSSLQIRWRTLQAAVNKFCGCFAASGSRNESGKTLEDKVADAHMLYHELHKLEFTSQSVWTILRHAPKWLEAMTAKKPKGKRARAAEENREKDGDEDGNDSELLVERPGGRKEAKRVAVAEDSQRAIAASLAKLAAETVQKNRLLEETKNEQIMARNLDGMSATARRFYELKQAQILKALEEEIINQNQG